MGRIVPRFHGWDTGFTTHSIPPCQGDGTQLIATSSAWGERARLAPSRKMPLTNLCSRLIVTGIRKPPRSRAWSLRSADLRDPLEPRTRHASTERDTSRPRRRGLAVAGITCLEWRNRFGADLPAVAPKPPPHGISGCSDMTRTGVVNPCTSRDSKTTDASFR